MSCLKGSNQSNVPNVGLLSTSATAEPSHVPDAPLSFNAAWQSVRNVATNFLCLLHKQPPTLVLTENTLEDLVDRERGNAPKIFLVPLSFLPFGLAVIFAQGQGFSGHPKNRVNINKKTSILSKMRRKMIKW